MNDDDHLHGKSPFFFIIQLSMGISGSIVFEDPIDAGTVVFFVSSHMNSGDIP